MPRPLDCKILRVVDRRSPRTSLGLATVLAIGVAALATPIAGGAQLYIAHIDTLGRDPYASTLFFGTGLIQDPVAWVSPNSGNVWVTFGGLRIPSVPNPAPNPLWYWNDNFSIDTHWLHRFSVGASLYSNNGEWGAFGQALLLRDGQLLGFLPAIAVGVRNLGPYGHEDRFLLGHDITVDSTGQSHGFTPPAYAHFHTAPTLYAVATKELVFDEEPLTISSVSFTLGGGNGLFLSDGGLGSIYDNRGTVIPGVFFGVRAVSHPLSNTIVSVVLENDAWDWNAGLVGNWRGLSFGVYGVELQDGPHRDPFDGFLVYNYAKLAVTIGYTGNLRAIVHGQILRTDITGLQRDRRRLEREITRRQQRIDRLQATLATLEGSELGDAVRRRQALEQQMREEQEAIQRATERLRQLEGTAPK